MPGSPGSCVPLRAGMCVLAATGACARGRAHSSLSASELCNLSAGAHLKRCNGLHVGCKLTPIDQKNHLTLMFLLPITTYF